MQPKLYRDVLRTHLLLFLVTSMVPVIAGNIRDLMIKHMEYFCPHSKICGYVGKPPIYIPYTQPCCKDCSCEPDCEVQGNCCYPSHPGDLECLFPKAYTESITQDFLHNAFYMVTTCPSPSKSTKCGDEKVGPWGSMFPVYSNLSGRIYKNEICAACHGVTDAIRFQTQMDCVQFSNSFFDISAQVDTLVGDGIPENCKVYFNIPKDLSLEEIQSQVCYDGNSYSTCSLKEFNVPADSPLTKSEIIQACESGLHAPVYYMYRFLNVFCMLCNGAGNVTGICPEDGMGRGDAVSFRMILELDKIKDFTEKKRAPIATACHTTDTSNCRNVLCPSGQINTVEGTCEYPVANWFVSGYLFLLKLTPLQKVSPQFLAKLRMTTQLSDIVALGSTLSHPLPSVCSVGGIYHRSRDKQSQDEEFENYFMASFECLGNTNARYIVQGIQKALLEKEWLLKLDLFQSIVKPEFMPYHRLVQQGLNNFVPRWYLAGIGLYLDSGTNEFVSSHYRDGDLIRGLTHPKDRPETSSFAILSRMYYCPQIELTSDEFQLYDESGVLRTRYGGYYFKGEFNIMTTHDGRKVTRVCLGNSSFVTLPNSSHKVNLSNLTCLLPLLFLFSFACRPLL